MTKKKPKLLSRMPEFEAFGPGLVTGAADDDPSGIATYTITGAQYGLGFLWTAWLTWPLMACVQITCAKLVIVTRRSLTDLMLARFPRPLVLVLIVGLFAANTLNVAADLAGMGDALALLTGGDAKGFTALLGGLITLMMLYLSYRQMARLLTLFTFCLLAYVFTAFKADVNWGEVWTAFVRPAWPADKAQWSTLVALLGTTISPYLFFWQAAQELEEVHQKQEQGERIVRRRSLRARRADVLLGTFVSNVIMFFVIVTASASLHRNGLTDVTTTAQAAEALEPLLGASAALGYTLGLLGVGLLAIPTLSGSAAFALADYFECASGLDKKWGEARAFYSVIILSTALALAIDLVGINPLKALFWSAVVNGVLSPFLLVVLFLLVVDAGLMKNFVAARATRLLLLLTTAIMSAAALAMFLL